MIKNKKIIAAMVLFGIATVAISAEPFDALCDVCGPASVISIAPEREAAIQQLQKSFQLRMVDAEIKQCSLVVRVPFAHFSAVGGSCDVSIQGKTAQWMICADDGVGNFAAVVGARWWRDPKSYLTQFVASNCVGG
jgi:hypothetical protein